MENYEHIKTLFAVFQREKATFERYFLLHSLLSYVDYAKIVYLDFIGFLLCVIISSSGFVFISLALSLVILYIFYLLKYLEIRGFLLGLYDNIEKELKNQLTDVEKITTLDHYLEEMDTFFVKNEGVKKRIDSFSLLTSKGR